MVGRSSRNPASRVTTSRVTIGLSAVFALLAVSHAGVAHSEDDRETSSPSTIRPGDVTLPQSPPPSSSTSCGPNMIEVEGDYCPEPLEQKCLKWSSKEAEEKKRGRCLQFAPSPPCTAATTHKRYCMDKFEYPNRVGEDPLVMKNWYEAKALCTAAGKRLCTDAEWTLACEGKEHLPYPYGLNRDSQACNIDKSPINVHEEVFKRPGPARDAEVKRLWQGEASGSRPNCKSPYGVMDMTGNVDEWVVNETGKPHHSALKGGYWSFVRGRCRPTTDGHEEDFRFYQIGFRCCTDAPGTPAPATPATASR